MTKHEENKSATSPAPTKITSSEESSKGTLHENSQIKQQGEVYQGKKTYFVKGTDVGRENQNSNERPGQNGKPVYPTTDLKNNTNGKDGEKNNKFQDGDYYLDGKKVILLNKSSEVDKDIILIYHPEFLYLMYTILADFASQDLNQKSNSNPYILPVKYTFGNIVHSEPAPGESENGAPPSYYFSTIKGNGQSSGSGRKKRSIGTSKTFDPTQTPKEEQI